MDVIRFALESGFFTILFAVWEPMLFFSFWGAVLLGGGIEYLILRFTKKRWLCFLLPSLLAAGILACMIAGQGVTGWDVFAFIIPWFGCFALLFGCGIAAFLRYLLRRQADSRRTQTNT